jgi:hypothetical protein
LWLDPFKKHNILQTSSNCSNISRSTIKNREYCNTKMFNFPSTGRALSCRIFVNIRTRVTLIIHNFLCYFLKVVCNEFQPQLFSRINSTS